MLKTLFDGVRSFLKLEAASGLVLMAAAVLALVIANSSASAAYAQFLATSVGPYSVSVWINDGLMAIFFFVVGMEIKHELIDGALASFDRAVLPVVAAIGGMIAPALVFLAFAGGGEYARGWGIPMATDIAFAVGVMALLGSRVPAQLKIFLLALAIADDLGAVLVIALFYSSGLKTLFLTAALAVAVFIWILALKRVRSVFVHLPLGVLVWWLVHHSGIHATIAGCALGFIMPHSNCEPEVLSKGQRTPAVSPLARWVSRLHPLSGFLIMPIFALANAGLSFSEVSWTAVFSDPVISGISYGLLLGKPLGIFGASVIAIRLGFAKLPDQVRYPQLIGAACFGGIGFTMALFIAGLALVTPESLELAKIGIVKGSLLSAILGVLIFMFLPNSSYCNERKTTATKR